MSVLIAIALKSLLIAGGTLGLLAVMKKRSAAERSWVAHIGLLALVIMAIAPLVLPSWTVETPAIFASDPAPVSKEAAAPIIKEQIAAAVQAKVDANAAPVAAAASEPSISATAAAVALYAVPAAILLFITLLALGRLITLRARADVLVDGHWLSALARAQRRMGFKHGTALLTSNELASPISWGLMRPVILLNSRAVEASNEAEAIIAHELAHVAHVDWVKLLLARVATALFWFNPLVWMLAREAHQLREETADDTVLAANIPDTDYAQLLVGVARHECPGMLLGAHGVAPSKSSLARRVARVLDGKSVRGPVARSFALGVLVGAVLIATPLAALTVGPKSGGSTKLGKAVASDSPLAPYYPETEAEGLPTDLPSLITSGVSTSVQTALAAVNPNSTLTSGSGGVIETRAPSGATVRQANGMTVATAPSGATVTMYPPDQHGRRKVVARAPNGAVAVSYADDEDEIPGFSQHHEKKMERAIDRAISMKAVGVTSEYVAAMRASSPALRDLDAGEFVGMKAVGVTPQYVRDLVAAGIGDFDSDDLAGARAVGVDGAYVRAIRSAGLGDADLSDLTGARAVGVTVAYVREMRALGLGDLDLDDLTGARAVGVTADYIRQMRARGYDGDLSDYTSLRAVTGHFGRARPTPPAPPRPPNG
ncbi:MAG TPA: M56 family metallopeptidase [Sphingomicrobium sp.]|jgi:beta-lactamase regulating signal transducer with metallopeptidase domain